MAGRIKGITVEIGGDTTGLEKALKNVNSTIKNTQSQLKDVNRLLKLDPGNTELITQKQRALKDLLSFAPTLTRELRLCIGHRTFLKKLKLSSVLTWQCLLHTTLLTIRM